MSGAILLLTACGSGSDTPNQSPAVKEQVAANEQTSVNQHDQQIVSETGEAWVALGSSTNNPSSSVQQPSSTNNSSSTSSDAGAVKGWAHPNESSSSADNTSSSAYSSSPSTGSVSAATPSNKIGFLEWEHPSERANGEYLELEDIAGYELRYSRDNEHYESIVIPGSKTTSYKIPFAINNIKGIKVEIAVFDTNGLYSEFVDISPAVN